jgi:hypothetical protein
MVSVNLHGAIAVADTKVREGNLPLAELICREALDRGFDHPAVFTVLGNVAVRVGMLDFARRYFDQALQRDSTFAPALQARDALEQSITAESREHTGAQGGRRYLLIKAWGYGFWSDIDHVLGQLLCSEMTARIPVVYWGKNSLFGDGQGNAFHHYFEPVADCTVEALRDPSLTFFPPKWNAQNLLEEDVNKWSGRHSRMAALYALNRSEDVVVSDFHTHVCTLQPWIRPAHRLYRLDTRSLYRHLFAKYLRLRAHLQHRVETFWTERLAGHRWLAVHVRGSDKEREVPNLGQLNMQYQRTIEETLQHDQELSVFLLTDSTPILEEYRARYQSRLRFTDSIRTAAKEGVHYSGHGGRQIGEEVAIDTYLAARCDRFLGNGLSNVSTTIEHMKEWGKGDYRLLGGNSLLQRNFIVHDR